MKAYQDPAFLSGEDARAVRILSEYLAPLAAFREQRVHDTIVFFGSARQGAHGPFARYYEDARELSRLITLWSKEISADGKERFLVCSGGGGGIMEAANRGAAEAGGRTIGLNIGLPHEQRPNAFITPGLSFEFHYFFMRKLWFTHLARAMVVFPGGYGTLDEMFETLTLSQTGKLERPVFLLLYGSSYWREIVNFDALVKNGMISPRDAALMRFADDPHEAFRLLREALPVGDGKTGPDIAESVSL
jgi:uncharacterized protein (TIGR00730 family)